MTPQEIARKITDEALYVSSPHAQAGNRFFLEALEERIARAIEDAIASDRLDDLLRTRRILGDPRKGVSVAVSPDWIA